MLLLIRSENLADVRERLVRLDKVLEWIGAGGDPHAAVVGGQPTQTPAIALNQDLNAIGRGFGLKAIEVNLGLVRAELPIRPVGKSTKRGPTEATTRRRWPLFEPGRRRLGERPGCMHLIGHRQ